MNNYNGKLFLSRFFLEEQHTVNLANVVNSSNIVTILYSYSSFGSISNGSCDLSLTVKYG